MIFKVNISLLLLAVLFLHNTASMPSFDRRQVPEQGPSGVLDVTTEKCTTFEHYCNRFGYNSTHFPNIIGHQNVGEAAKGFAAFDKLLNTNCSAKIGIFLCFVYFPYCDPRGFLIMPCKDTCIEAQTEECTAYVLSANPEGWVKHLQCNYTRMENKVEVPVYKDEICANGTNLGTCTGEDCSDNGDGDDGDSDDSNDTKDDTADEDDKTEETTESPQLNNECEQETHDCINNEVCVASNNTSDYECKCPDKQRGDGRINGTGCTDCSECDMRNNANANTFKKNCYTFAAKVTVHSVSKCGECYCVEFQVDEQFDLQTRDTVTGSMTQAPNMTDTITIKLPAICCLCAIIIDNKQMFLIGGIYKPEQAIHSPPYTWEIPEKNGLLAMWQNKFDEKLATWLDKANKDRETSDCTVTLA